MLQMPKDESGKTSHGLPRWESLVPFNYFIINILRIISDSPNDPRPWWLRIKWRSVGKHWNNICRIYWKSGLSETTMRLYVTICNARKMLTHGLDCLDGVLGREPLVLCSWTWRKGKGRTRSEEDRHHAHASMHFQTLFLPQCVLFQVNNHGNYAKMMIYSNLEWSFLQIPKMLWRYL
jgi:hypothetical protein